MLLAELLGIPKGVTAIIGSGGKTTAMYTLAGELRRRGSVICATTTRIFPPSHIPVYTGESIDELLSLLLERGCICVGSSAENGKLAESAIDVSVLARLADFVLIEADGSKGLPMKAHLGHEPVIPKSAKTVVLMVGAEGFGKTVQEVAHRSERFCQLSGLELSDVVTPEAAAAVIRAEGLAGKIFVNQAESDSAMENARALSSLVDVPVFAGALQKGEWKCLL